MEVLDPNPLTEELSFTEYQPRCPECGSERCVQDYNRAEVVCSSCGLVIEDRIPDPGREWRGITMEEILARERGGPPTTYRMYDKGLSTVMDPTNYDARGKALGPNARRIMSRLRRWNRRTRSRSVKRNLVHGLSELDRIADQLRLPRQVREAASIIFRQSLERGLLRGRALECWTGSAIYIACREFRIPRTLGEVAEVTRYDKKKIGRSYRTVTRTLGIHLPPVSPLDYIPRFTSKLGLPQRVERMAIEILKEALRDQENNKTVSGKGPTGVAAAVIYAACLLEGVQRTQDEVAKITGSTPVTVRNRYKEIAEHLDLDL